MVIIDFDNNNTDMKCQMAHLIKEAFPQSYGKMDVALKEVDECADENTILKVAIDDELSVLGWIGGRSEYDGNVWELHPLVVDKRCRG
ncbi:MAG: hypothetical protein KAQ68_05445, partial [Clostridiales bacterium]|nr:hypothetical protein [Clostridiales bacterium]